MAIANYMSTPKMRTQGGFTNSTSGGTQQIQQPRPQTDSFRQQNNKWNQQFQQPQRSQNTMSTNMGMNPNQGGYGQPQRSQFSTQGAPAQQPAPQWGLGQWNPTPYQQPNVSPPNPAGQGGVEKGFFEGGGQNFFNPESFTDPENPYSKYINSMLPVAQFGQNNFQYRNDFNEAQRRWQAEFGATQGQNQFQQGLSTRQQQAAEAQAALAAQQWGQQFGHTQNMDYAGLDLSQQQIGNQFTMGMDQNQATRDVANIYGNSNINQAHIGASADRYGADRQVEGAYAYADAQKHAANMGVNEAHIGAAANRYGSELGLEGQLGSANIYGGAQRYQSDQELAAAKYQWDMQMRMNQAMMQNNLQVANTAAYGRSQAPQATWARSWS
jgi:hypothetical protein